MTILPLEEYFRYHPSRTEERVIAHDRVNNAAMAMARLIEEVVEDEDCRKMAVFALQQCRMFANQGITIDELRKLAIENASSNT